MPLPENLANLRRTILETLRVQREGPETIPYIDVGHTLTDIAARQNHAVFGRRGCGKTLLLHHSAKELPRDVRRVYINCEDFKTHSFPNVLIEILDAVFKELDHKQIAWFGRKKRLKQLIAEMRGELHGLHAQEDEREQSVRETFETETSRSSKAEAAGTLKAQAAGFNASLGRLRLFKQRDAVEREYKQHDSKAKQLNALLSPLKDKIREFFTLSNEVQAVFVEIDDFYHLRRVDQPHVMDYVHRLCKDLPLYFKVATLRHASVLYADRQGQPTGAQARHDYQPIDVDFTLENIAKTERQFHEILYEFGRLSGVSHDEIDGLFKGDGFRRLVLAGGGVPRDCLSLFLEVLDSVSTRDGRIGKDDVRFLSLETFERRIEELKSDCEAREQDALLAGIYVIRNFCMEKKQSAFLVSEQLLRDNGDIRELLYRLLDYRIIHQVASALTHKHRSGTYRAFVIDVGCYAFMRKLKGRFTEIDLWERTAREKLRSVPVIGIQDFAEQAEAIPEDVEMALKTEPEVP
jgi:hypothetical protein